MVQDTYQNGVGSALFVSGVLSNSALACSGLHMHGLFRLPPSRSAQVRLSLPRSIPTCRFSQVLPGSPRKLVISCDFVGFRDFLGEPGCYFLRFCGVSGISWENLGVIFCVFVGFRDFLGEPGCYFLRFCGFLKFPGRTWVLFSAFLWVSGISWENLNVIFCAFVGFPGFPGRTWVETVGDGPGRAARVSSGKSGWRVARYFDPQFLNFCRRRCRPLWPAGLPRFKV